MSASLLEPRLENYTLPYLYLHPDLCTFDTCPLNYGFILYIPSLGANAFFLSLFSLFIFVQVYLGIRYRTIGFTTAMFIGIALETIGYVARIQMHSNTFLKSHFLMYLICLTIGPVFIAAAIYLCLSRIVIVFDPLEKITLLRARSYMLIFCTCDFLSLILQAVGGAIASTATDHPMIIEGTHIMVAGLSVQVASLLLFATMCLEFGWRLRASKGPINTKHQGIYTMPRFRYFLFVLAFATLCIFIRSVFRVAELSGGFSGPLANNQVSFMVLDGAMMILASFALCVLHPGIGFGGSWGDANFHFRKHTELQKGEMSEEGNV